MKTLIAISIAATALLLVPSAHAHRLEKKPAVKAAKAEATEVAEATDADRTAFGICKRESKHAFNCVARFHYSESGTMCDVPIRVFYKNHRAKRIRRETGETLCY